MKYIFCVIALCLYTTCAFAEYVFLHNGELTGEFRTLNKVVSDENGERTVQHDIVVLDRSISVSCDINDAQCKESKDVAIIYLKNNEKMSNVFKNNINSINYVYGKFHRGLIDGNQEVVYIEPENIAGQSFVSSVKVEKPVLAENKMTSAVKRSELAQDNKGVGGLSSKAKNFFAGFGDDLYMMVFIGLAIVGVFLLVAGACRRVVIYYDTSDMVVSLAAGVLIILFPAFIEIIGIKQVTLFSSDFMNFLAKWIVIIVGILSTIISVFITFNNAIKHNRSFMLGIFIGLFKLLFVAITALIMIAQVLRILEHKSGREMFLASAILTVFGSFVGIMINGKEVYEAKGWQLPEDGRA